MGRSTHVTIMRSFTLMIKPVPVQEEGGDFDQGCFQFFSTMLANIWSTPLTSSCTVVCSSS